MKTARNAELRMRNSESTAKPFRTPNSELHLARALQYLVGGVNSPVRAFRQVGGEPMIVRSASGAEVADAAGRRYLDFISGWGALILGHNPPAVTPQLRKAVSRGTIFGLTSPEEAQLAEAIARSTPSVERVRFTASGTEACMTAVKLARAHTRRSKILAFEGGYHGHADSLMGSASAGVTQAAAADLIRVSYNDAAGFAHVLQQHGDRIACAIVEPVAANMGVVAPQPGFLQALREQTTRYNTLLIFDEVVTGFRLGYGGAQNRFNVRPDLTVFGKIIGGGLPIGAVAGPAALMSKLAPEGPVYHGGTFAGHPLAMAAGLATLRALESQAPYERLDALASRLAEGLTGLGQKLGIPLTVNRAGSMITPFFTDQPVRNFKDAARADRELFARWANGLRRERVLVPPSPTEALFLTAAHTAAHIDRVLAASRAALTGTNGR
jgi:glutamate-1-semialdehyde 2,1-aminomutase